MKLVMQGRLDPCFLLSFALSAKAVEGLLPGGIYPRTLERYAFLNIVISRIVKMRLMALPSTLGLTYWHIAYRLHAYAHLESGQSIEGLYFLRSDVDRYLPVIPGNALTDFRFHKSSIRVLTDDCTIRIKITDSYDGLADGEVVIDTAYSGDDRILSPFRSLDEREEMLKYAPFGLSVNRSVRWLKIAEVERKESEWVERPIRVKAARWGYLERLIPGEVRLVRATQVMPIDYRWRLGRVERLRKNPGSNYSTERSQ